MYFRMLFVLSTILFATNAIAQKNINKKPAPAKVNVHRLSDDINTLDADFAPARYGDRIYFTSTSKNETDGLMQTRIYSFLDGGKASLVEGLDLNSKTAHIANLAFMPDASKVYFSICKGIEQNDCEIWYREKEYEGNWGAAKKLPEPINLSGSSSTQPSIGWDEEQKKFALFFVSDRSGGRGGKDVWVSHITWDGQFETPYSLPINSTKDDVTPYFDRISQTLYFSSNGMKGVGGFDIFQSNKIGDMWAPASNLGRPYNSAYDDLYFTIHDKSGKAYFTSDRPGSYCNNGAIDGWNCFDIYEAVENEAYKAYMSNVENMTDKYKSELVDN